MLRKTIVGCFGLLTFAIISGVLDSSTLAQENDAPISTRHGTYHSDVDDLLTVEKVSVLPFTDNLEGIYARPLETYFISLVDGMHRWDFVPATGSGPILAPEELEDSPAKALQISQGLKVDAFFAARATKGPNGITIHLSLFLSKDGKLLGQAVLKDYDRFDLTDLKEQTQRLLSEIVSRLPYSGRVLSRDGNRLTVNLGARDGLQNGQMLSVVQIIQAQRHPKFNFLVNTDKEIFGKIKILKVDETLSFATVVTEKERGAIQKNSKIGTLDFVSYAPTQSLSLTPSPEEALGQREDGKIVFGKDALAWQQQPPPTFGQIGARLGMSQASENLNISSGSLSVGTFVAPSLLLEGEIWITPEWTFAARMSQGIIQASNPRAGSDPPKLNQSVSNYEGGFGYRFRFGPHIWSPYLEPFLAYFTSNLYTDATTPQTYTTMNYNGFKIGARGATPISSGGEYGAGLEFGIALKSDLHESPVTSGASATTNVTNFQFFAYKKMSERLKAQLELDFSMYSANFSGRGTRAEPANSASQRFTTLSGGLYYLF